VRSEQEAFKVAVEAAEEAGRRLLRLSSSPKLSVKRKYDYPGSIVTNADIESEKIILNRIKRSRIKSTVSSEEAGTVDFGSDEVVWAIDPLDGTFNFAKRIPHFAVSIGILAHNKPMAGVIYNPVLDEMFTASRSHGARLNGRKIHVSDAEALRDSALIFEWWNPEPLIPDPPSFVKMLYGYTRNIRSPGSVALNLCSLASRRFDGLLTVFQKAPIFEVAAGCVIAEEAGGCVTNSSGESWESFSGSIVAGGAKVHGQLLSLIRERATVN
jgi:myo-inositol-1(or 4)-monophosphatase